MRHLWPVALAALLTGCAAHRPPPAPTDPGPAIRAALGGDWEARYFQARADLDGDGRPEILAYVAGPMVCGTGGCPLMVFTPTAEGLRLVSHLTVVQVPVRLSPRRQHGWRNVVVRIGGGGVAAASVELAFDGRSYPPNPTVAPRAPVPDLETLPVLIPEFSSYRDGVPVPPPVYGDPVLPPVARVLGTTIHTRDVDELRLVVLDRLTARFAVDQGIVVTSDERDAYIRDVDRVLRARGVTPVGTDSAEDRAAREQIAVLFVRQWKIHRALHQRYGGRIAFQQGIPEPLDALRRFVEAQQARGDLTFLDPAMGDAFWRYYRDDTRHSFYPPGSAEEARVFAAPPWAGSR